MTKTAIRVRTLNEDIRHNKVQEHNAKVGNIINAVTGGIGAIGSVLRGAGALKSKRNLTIGPDAMAKLSEDDKKRAADIISRKASGLFVTGKDWKWFQSIGGNIK